jgi:hypothetical protein
VRYKRHITTKSKRAVIAVAFCCPKLEKKKRNSAILPPITNSGILRKQDCDNKYIARVDTKQNLDICDGLRHYRHENVLFLFGIHMR